MSRSLNANAAVWVGVGRGVCLNVQALAQGAPEPSAMERGERAMNCPICRGGGWSLPGEIKPTTSRFIAADADWDPESGRSSRGVRLVLAEDRAIPARLSYGSQELCAPIC